MLILMRKIFSERNLVVFLFLAALVIFSFAQEDAKRVERMYFGNDAAVSTSLMPSLKKTAIVPGPVIDEKNSK